MFGPVCGALILLNILDYAGCESDVWCYECGTGVVGSPGCEEFVRASTWSAFWRRCSEDALCVKTVPGWNTSMEERAVRGCTPRVSLGGKKHREGCWTNPTSSFLTCYCTASLCNAAPLNTPHTIMLLLGFWILRRSWFE